MRHFSACIRLGKQLAAVAAIALLASTQSAYAGTHTNRLAVRLTDLIASNMEAGVERRVTTETAARGVTAPYQLGFDRAQNRR